MKEIRDYINRWRDILCSYVRRVNVVKMTILPKAIYRINEISIKVPIAFFIELEQKILYGNNFFVFPCMETQKTPNNQAILRKQSRAGRIRHLHF